MPDWSCSVKYGSEERPNLAEEAVLLLFGGGFRGCGLLLALLPGRWQNHRIDLHDFVVLQLQSGDARGQVGGWIIGAEDKGRFHHNVLLRRRRRLGLGRLGRWLRRLGFHWRRRRRRWRRSFRHLCRLRDRTSAILLRANGLAEMSALKQHGFVGLHLIRRIAHALGDDNGGGVPRQ